MVIGIRWEIWMSHRQFLCVGVEHAINSTIGVLARSNTQGVRLTSIQLPFFTQMEVSDFEF